MKQQITITPEAAALIPRQALLQFLQGHGLEMLVTMDGKTVRPAAQPKDYATTDEAA